MKLDLDGLNVETFEAQPQMYERGTVNGADASVDGTCIDYTCRNYGTCRPSVCTDIP
ncbi:MAG TPA: hypothetical protein VFJ16_23325 [Longimicrobium sp.]|nr:hypothetical protein [Longimicrobium sp.]